MPQEGQDTRIPFGAAGRLPPRVLSKGPRSNDLCKLSSGWHALSVAKGVFCGVATPFACQGFQPYQSTAATAIAPTDPAGLLRLRPRSVH